MSNITELVQVNNQFNPLLIDTQNSAANSSQPTAKIVNKIKKRDDKKNVKKAGAAKKGVAVQQTLNFEKQSEKVLQENSHLKNLIFDKAFEEEIMLFQANLQSNSYRMRLQ